MNGSDAAGVARGGALDAATGATRKQPATRISSMTPTETLIRPVGALQIRSPTQWERANAARIEIATACG